jgi:hypothetical protein
MIIIFSGEGPTDIGTSKSAVSPCQPPDFIPGPMAALVDIAIERVFDYSPLDTTPASIWFISETELNKRAKQQSKRSLTLRGSKGPEVETGFFHINAKILAQFALEKEAEHKDVSMAVLFRDHDGTRSTHASLWETKVQSMHDGFHRAQYPRGVAMLPKPKSEAWLLCLATNPLPQNCAALEEISGNDDSPNSAKAQLDQAHGRHYSTPELIAWIKQCDPDFDHLSNMPSFARFRTQLHAVFDNLKSGGNTA